MNFLKQINYLKIIAFTSISKYALKALLFIQYKYLLFCENVVQLNQKKNGGIIMEPVTLSNGEKNL